MRLGTRWGWGQEPPSKLPQAVVAAIREVEQKDAGSSELKWTLTWLEGRPIVELDPLPGSGEVTVIRFRGADGTVYVTSGDSRGLEDEEWDED